MYRILSLVLIGSLFLPSVFAKGNEILFYINPENGRSYLASDDNDLTLMKNFLSVTRDDLNHIPEKNPAITKLIIRSSLFERAENVEKVTKDTILNKRSEMTVAHQESRENEIYSLSYNVYQKALENRDPHDYAFIASLIDHVNLYSSCENESSMSQFYLHKGEPFKKEDVMKKPGIREVRVRLKGNPNLWIPVSNGKSKVKMLLQKIDAEENSTFLKSKLRLVLNEFSVNYSSYVVGQELSYEELIELFHIQVPVDWYSELICFENIASELKEIYKTAPGFSHPLKSQFSNLVFPREYEEDFYIFRQFPDFN